MIDVFLQSHIDFVYFIISILLLNIAAISFILYRKEDKVWIWFCLYALCHAFNSWIDIALVSHYSIIYYIHKVVFSFMGYIFLVKFSSMSLGRLIPKGIGIWVIIPLLLIEVSGVIKGIDGLSITIIYSIALTACLLVAICVYSFVNDRWLFLILCFFFLLNTFFNVMGISEVGFFNLFLPNKRLVLSLTSIPVQFYYCIFLFALYMVLALYLRKAHLNRLPKESRGVAGIFYVSNIIILVLLLIVSSYFIGIKHKETENTMKKNLLSRAQLAVAAINPERIRSLQASLQDTSKEDYKRLKEQITKMRSANDDIRFIYLWNMKHGIVHFLVDSEPEESPDYSPPGQVYYEVSPADTAHIQGSLPYC